MTEIEKTTTTPLDELPPAIRRFILHWGDMGGQWGVNRTVSQIHALLYISEQPMNAEQISETLGVARSNVSNSLKELLTWRLAERVPVPGDRRDYFTSETDVWEIAFRIAAMRKEREIDPALRTLTSCLEEAESDSQISKAQLEKLESLRDFTASLEQWYKQMLRVPSSTLSRLVKAGDRIVDLVNMARRRRENG